MSGLDEQEQVLVVPKHYVLGRHAEGEKLVWRDGDSHSLLKDGLSGKHLSFMGRARAETDEEFLQLIPYVCLKKGDTLFVYRRSTKGGENRLHGMLSVGVGGHINPSDGPAGEWSTYVNGMSRELAEEISIVGDYEQSVIGAVYNGADSVGRVHFGIVHLLDLYPDTEVRPLDPALADAGFRPITELCQRLGEAEVWSALVLEHLIYADHS